MAQARKIIDIPLAEVAPQEVRVRLLSEEFAHLKRQRHESKVSWQSAQADRSVGGPALLRAFDAHMVANSRLEAYKDATAALLPPVAVPESGFALPDGVTLLGEAESGTLRGAPCGRAPLEVLTLGPSAKLGSTANRTMTTFGTQRWAAPVMAKRTPGPRFEVTSGSHGSLK